MINSKIEIEHAKFNRYELLDKIDTLHKLMGVTHRFIGIDDVLYHKICNEISITAKSTARLFLFDNKHYEVCSLPISLYDKLYTLLDSELPLSINVSYKNQDKD